MGEAYDSLSRKHRLFVDNLFKAYFNGKRAYLRTYPGVEDTTAEVNSCKLLSKTKINKAIDEKIKEGGLDKLLTEESLKKKALDLLEQGKESTKARILELLFKAQGLTKDTTIQPIAIFSNVEKELRKVPTQPIEQQEDRTQTKLT